MGPVPGLRVAERDTLVEQLRCEVRSCTLRISLDAAGAVSTRSRPHFPALGGDRCYQERQADSSLKPSARSTKNTGSVI
jgi:hypothetical protein